MMSDKAAGKPSVASRGSRGEREEQVCTGDSGGCDTSLCDNVIVDMQLTHLSMLTELHNTKSEP